MAVEKRRSHGWQAFGSYTLSRAYGLQPSSGTTAAGAQVATVGSPPGLFASPVTFGRDPNDLTNARRAPPQRSSAHLPRHDLGRCPAHRLRRRRQSAALQRQAMGGDRADQPARHVSGACCSSRVARNGCRRKRSSTSASPGRSASASVARVELRLDVLNLLNDTAGEERGDRRVLRRRVWSGQHLHGPAPRDGQRQAEPRPIVKAFKFSQPYSSGPSAHRGPSHNETPQTFSQMVACEM